MSKTNKTRGWDKAQVRSFVNDAIRQHKSAWELVPSLRTAIIAQRYAAVVSGQASDTIATEKLAHLWTDMLEEAGLMGDGAA